MKFRDFIMGIVTGLIAVTVMLAAIFFLSIGVGFDGDEVLLVTIVGFNAALLLFGMGIALYYVAVVRGKIGRDDRVKDLVLELNSIESAMKDIEKGYFKRNIDAESKNSIMNDLKRREAKLKNQIKILQNRDDEDGD